MKLDYEFVVKKHYNKKQQKKTKKKKKKKKKNKKRRKKKKNGKKEIKKQNSILKQAEELAKAGSWEYNIHTQEFTWSDGMYKLFEIKKGSPVTPSVYLDHVIEKDRHEAQKLVDDIQKNFQPLEIT